MKPETTLMLAVASLSLLWAGCHSETIETAPTVTAATATGLDADEPGLGDSLFASHTLVRGAAEIDISRLGIDRAETPDLKLLALRMFDDQSRAHDDLQLIVHVQAIPVSLKMGSPDALISLQQFNGINFDRLFIH